MKSKVLVVSSLVLGLSSALIAHTAVAKDDETRHSICVDGYAQKAGQAASDFLDKHTGACVTPVNLDAIQDKIKNSSYANINEISNKLVNRFKDKTYFGAGSSLVDRVGKYSLAGKFHKGLIANELEKQLMDQNIQDELLQSATNDLMKDYRNLRNYEARLISDRSAAGELQDKDKITKLDQRIAKVQSLTAELKQMFREQTATLGLNLKPEESDRLLTSAVGQEELKLIIIGRTVDASAVVMQKRMEEAKNRMDNTEAYIADLALLNRIAAASIQTYVDHISKYIKVLKDQIKDSQQLIKNNQANNAMSAEARKVNEQVQEFAKTYIEILKQRSDQMGQKKLDLQPNFAKLAVNLKTTEISNLVIGTIASAEQNANHIEDFLKIGNLSNTGADGIKITQEALDQIENKLFGVK